MTDVLTERFAALADLRDDSDWLDVRRRARRRRTRVALPVAVVAAALAATAAFAAVNGNWIFRTQDGTVTARTQVSLAGRTWQVSLKTLAPEISVCLQAASGTTVRSMCQAGLRRSTNVPIGAPYGALHLNVAGGQLWMGITLGFVRRVSITDATGRGYSTPTIDAPRAAKTPFRYWAIAIANPPAKAISAYDDQGRKLPRYLGY
jgi:hypothetical protein